jgi:Tfp pilus assembly protein PilN
MINLLPPSIKEQVRYAKLNRLAMRYLSLALQVSVLLAAVFGASIYFLNQQAASIEKDAAAKQQEIASLAPDLAKAQAAAERLNAIKAIQNSQTRFSVLLSDLAKVLPKGVTLDSITLTGNDKTPVRIGVTGNSYNAMLAFREALLTSSRISGVDLENVTQTGPGTYASSVVIGFKPGQAK